MTKTQIRNSSHIQDLPQIQKPREKLLALGPSNLSTVELVAAILGSGTRENSVLDVAQQVVAQWQSLISKQNSDWDKQRSRQRRSQQKCSDHGQSAPPLKEKSQVGIGQQLTPLSLQQITGVGQARACALIACFELANRLQHQQTNTKLDRPHKVFHLSNDIKDKSQEYCLGLYLNGRQELLKKKTIAIGGLNSNYPDFRQILAPAITLPASNLILVHNHPSGDPRPSRSDLQLTEKVQHVAELIGVSLIDHIIVASQEFYSFKRGGLLG